MDPYEILGLGKNCTKKEIRCRYLFLVKQCHPDKNGDKTKFQQIEHAYKTLYDPKSFSIDLRSEEVAKEEELKKKEQEARKKEEEIRKKYKIKKNQTLDDFLSDLMKDGIKKTKKSSIFDF